MTRRSRWYALCVVCTLVSALIALPTPVARASGPTHYRWPVVGPIIGHYDPPTNPYGSGHRGIDIAAPFGSPVVAAADGVVAFAGRIGSGSYVSIDHPDGIRTTYSWLGALGTARGRTIQAGQVIGASGIGHPGSLVPHLHFGARIADTYLDPLSLLAPPDRTGWVRLVPTRDS